MARKLRIEYPGACYHIINRGNYRSNIFKGNGSAAAFERVMFQAIERFNWKVSAYVIMSNHYHLALEIAEPNLSLGMKWLQGTWVTRNNVYRKRTGRPFQGRYKAILLEPGAMENVVSYIHLNPYRAGIEATGQIGEYRWSSLSCLPSIKSRPFNLNPAVALDSLGGLKDTPYAWKKYYQYLEALAEDEPAQRQLQFEKLSKGWCFGGHAFREATIKEHLQKGADLDMAQIHGTTAEESHELREKCWEQTLQKISELSGISLESLGAKKSEPQKVKLAAMMKRKTSVSNRWLTERLDMGKPASVSKFVGRFEQQPDDKLKS